MKNRMIVLVFTGLFCTPFFSFSQDSIPVAKDLTEEKELKFQQFFFKALAEKSITNYQKAIENLENCNEILPNNVSVFFEFSKNYLLLNKTFEAKEYINRALEKETENIWMLLHLVEIHKKDRNFAEAITIQQKIIKNHPKRRNDLVYLHLQNNNRKEAMNLLQTLENENNLSSRLKRLKNNLEKRTTKTVVKVEKDDIKSLIEKFENEKLFETLKKILEKPVEEKNQATLLEYSEKGIVLFPAQPFVYLVNGKVLNYQKSYKKAFTILKAGIDFVIEDKMEADFYTEMAISSEGNGDKAAAKKYRMLAKKVTVK